MPKKFLEDMVKAKRERESSIRQLQPKSQFKPKEIREQPREIIEKKEVELKIVDTVEFKTNYKRPTKSRSRFLLWFIAIFSIVFCFFAISLVFAKATVSVDPKIVKVTINENLSAIKDSNPNGLSFDLVVIPGEESQTVPATGQKNVSTSATGTVVIFNSFSSASQVLNINTRLQGSNGEIYKTQTETVVPGMSKDGTPGQVQVGIYAAAPGQAYNSGPLDFTIIGFKGTAKYSKFIVRSETNTQTTGGFVGQAPEVSPGDEAAALGNLKSTLQTSLLLKATAQIPDGYILFKDAVFLNTDDSNLTSVYNPDNTATLTLSGTLYGVILNVQDLTKKIATDNIQNYDGSDVYIPHIENLVFALSPTTTNTGSSTTTTPTASSLTTDGSNLSSAQNINFTLTGPAQIVWKLDTEKFTNDLLGKPKNDFTQILSQYSNIDSATLTVTPIWKMSIPDESKNVKVIVDYPN